MTLSAKELWKRVLEGAKRDIPEPMIQTWLSSNEAISLGGGTLVVSTPDDFAKRWNEEKYGQTLTSVASEAAGEPVAVAFQVAADRQKRPQMDLFVPPAPGEAPAGGTPAAVNPSAQPLNDRYTFGTFVIGKSNELAAAAAHAVAEAPGKQYNPFFIYGPTGLGKTHLMQAIAHEVSSRAPGTRVLYVGAEQFINEVIEGIHSRTMADLRKRYRYDVDLFLVDDVHFLEGKEATQEEFFHTFNALYEGGKQIVLTSDRPPKDIPGLEARLVSRFEWGMVADVKQPDLEHRIAILRKKQEQDHLETTIPDDVLRFMAENVRSNVRELEGCIIKLLLYASIRHREISIDLAREALADQIRPGDEGESKSRSLPTHPEGPGGGGAALGGHAGRAALQGADQDADGAAADRHVPCPRTAADAAGGNRAGVRRPRSLDGDSQCRQGAGAAEPRPPVPGARGIGPTGVVDSLGTVLVRAAWKTLASAETGG